MESYRSIVDLSMRISSLKTPVFPGYPQPVRSVLYTIEEQGYYSCIWNLVEHTGTHMDAPAHFLKNGVSPELVPLKSVISRGFVMDFRNTKPRYVITELDIKERLKEHGSETKGVLLLLTGYSKHAGKGRWFDYPELSQDACRFIIRKGFTALGTDAPSPDRAPFQAHRMLLQRGIVIFENLVNLERLIGRDFIFFGAPLPLCQGSASPVRAIALVK